MYDVKGPSMHATARNSFAAYFAASNVFRAMVLPLSTSLCCSGLRSGSPPGYSDDRRRVSLDLSRACEKVWHGGAKCRIRRRSEVRRERSQFITILTSEDFSKSVPPDSRSFGGRHWTPAAFIVDVSSASPAKNSANLMSEGTPIFLRFEGFPGLDVAEATGTGSGSTTDEERGAEEDALGTVGSLKLPTGRAPPHFLFAFLLRPALPEPVGLTSGQVVAP